MSNGHASPGRPNLDGAGSARSAKAALRRSALARRTARSAEERGAVAAALARHAAALAAAVGARSVAAYVGVGDEPDTVPALDALVAAGAEVLLPVTAGGPERRLEWARYEGAHRLAPAAYGLLEPVGERRPPETIASVDLVLVPALLVDRAGHRLGRGAGYYDRALAGARGATYAVVHDDEVVDAVPVEAHDVTVTGALTPSGALAWGS